MFKRKHQDPDLQYRKIFVGGLPHNLAMYHFRSYFAQYGQIEDSVILKDKRTNKPRGFGFITFKDKKSVIEVMKNVDRHTIQGKWVDCKCAIPEAQIKAMQEQDMEEGTERDQNNYSYMSS